MAGQPRILAENSFPGPAMIVGAFSVAEHELVPPFPIFFVNTNADITHPEFPGSSMCLCAGRRPAGVWQAEVLQGRAENRNCGAT